MKTNESPLHDLITLAMSLTPEQIAELNKMTGDPEDTVRLLGDVAAFRRFLADWNKANAAGASSLPTAPPLTSMYLHRVMLMVANEVEQAAQWFAQQTRDYLAQDNAAVVR